MLATKPEFAGEDVTVAHEQQKSERDEHRYQADDAIPLHAGQIARGYYADDNGGDHCAQEHHAFIGESQSHYTIDHLATPRAPYTARIDRHDHGHCCGHRGRHCVGHCDWHCRSRLHEWLRRSGIGLWRVAHWLSVVRMSEGLWSRLLRRVWGIGGLRRIRRLRGIHRLGRIRRLDGICRVYELRGVLCRLHSRYCGLRHRL